MHYNIFKGSPHLILFIASHEHVEAKSRVVQITWADVSNNTGEVW